MCNNAYPLSLSRRSPSLDHSSSISLSGGRSSSRPSLVQMALSAHTHLYLTSFDRSASLPPSPSLSMMTQRVYRNVAARIRLHPCERDKKTPREERKIQILHRRSRVTLYLRYLYSRGRILQRFLELTNVGLRYKHVQSIEYVSTIRASLNDASRAS